MEKNTVKDHFDQRSREYDNIPNSWVNNRDILDPILDHINQLDKENLNILDLGAGTGAVSKYLAENLSKSYCITALDISEKMLKKIDNPKINVCVADATKIPFPDNYFDVIVSRQCLHYIKNLDMVICEIKRVLKTNGVFILAQIVPSSNKTKNHWKKTVEFRQPLRENYFSIEDWISLFANHGFSEEDLHTCFHTASVLNWVKKYDIHDEKLIQKYKSLFLNAPEHYQKDYYVKASGNDVLSKSFWGIMMFRNTNILDNCEPIK